jgi:acyl CoA:acetate/3-ketoacid CoA transferase alpha subunit
MVGGFMGVGTPERLLDELVRQRKSELSVISNDAAVPGQGVGKLFDAALVATLTASHIGLNPKVQQQQGSGPSSSKVSEGSRSTAETSCWRRRFVRILRCFTHLSPTSSAISPPR